MLLLQIAASHAQIGPFAKRARETPQVAARRYGAAMAGRFGDAPSHPVIVLFG